MKHKHIALDLFSGCGGLSQGLEEAGFEVLACCEIRPEARETYHLNHPGAFLIDDIRNADPLALKKQLGLRRGQLDLLAGCPPCQGFSSIRTHNGEIADDPRNELIFQMERFVDAFKPKCILIENVPRLLQDARLALFKKHLSEKFGYEFVDGVLDAKDFNVPQRRKRMILIGSRLKKKPVLPEKSSVRKTVSDAIRTIEIPSGKEGESARRLAGLRQHFSPIVQARIEQIGTNRTDLPEDMVLECHQRYPNGFRDVYGRMAWDDVSPTITRGCGNPSKGRFIHPSENRAINMLEALILQGFPKTYKFPPELGIGKIASMIGEAFPPPMAKAQGEVILKLLPSCS
ncbi:MAG: DNA cytosine methyltransferase [Kiritimatiellae bacterium]|nr:DNA cytosine methyltransferase [Kiritimatiellia bacterium]